MDPVEYIWFMHKCLSEICNDSKLQGLKYYGGPEVTCKESDGETHTVVLHCVEYGPDAKVQDTPTINCDCPDCSKGYDVNQLLVIHILSLCDFYY